MTTCQCGLKLVPGKDVCKKCLDKEKKHLQLRIEDLAQDFLFTSSEGTRFELDILVDQLRELEKV